VHNLSVVWCGDLVCRLSGPTLIGAQNVIGLLGLSLV
jgi:hypothetical protein